jgi:hypothetical protein
MEALGTHTHTAPTRPQDQQLAGENLITPTEFTVSGTWRTQTLCVECKRKGVCMNIARAIVVGFINY